ncbi:hypothetical protein LTR53_001835 [Teratosphaeriaceae sp. CCFEE 6253]|nr:hypothetical protein LTR53_001835 [Teratosphaeriaceae sp. CCFEE 6253]
MGDPISGLAAQQAVTVGASLVTAGYKISKRVHEAAGKAEGFAKRMSQPQTTVLAIVQIVADVHHVGFVLDEMVAAQFGMTQDRHPLETLRAEDDDGDEDGMGPGSIYTGASWRLSPKSDVWQPGALLLSLLCGDHVRDELCGGAGAQIRVTLLSRLREQRAPGWLAPLSSSCLEARPEERPSSWQVLEAFRLERRRRDEV